MVTSELAAIFTPIPMVTSFKIMLFWPIQTFYTGLWSKWIPAPKRTVKPTFTQLNTHIWICWMVIIIKDHSIVGDDYMITNRDLLLCPNFSRFIDNGIISNYDMAIFRNLHFSVHFTVISNLNTSPIPTGIGASKSTAKQKTMMGMSSMEVRSAVLRNSAISVS